MQIKPATRAPAVSEETTIDNATGMQIEIPYVPAGQRATKRIDEERDTIIVVGQARQKRKRKAGEGTEPEASASRNDTSSSTIVPKQDEIEPFDFAFVPNILDDNPDTEDRKKKRQRKQAKGSCFFALLIRTPEIYIT